MGVATAWMAWLPSPGEPTAENTSTISTNAQPQLAMDRTRAAQPQGQARQ